MSHATDPIEQSLRDFMPVVRPPQVSGGDLAYAEHDTPVGRLLLVARPDGRLVSSAFTPDDAAVAAGLDRLARRLSPRILRNGDCLDDARRELDEYFAGRRHHFDLALDETLATAFQRQVLTRLRTDVRYGQTTTYGALALALGRPRASRAVGAALGANPLCVVLPCHRVVAASGALTGYAGGLGAKRLLLELEAAAVPS